VDERERMEEMKKKITSEQVKEYFDAWREVYKDKRLRGADWPILLIIRDKNYQNGFWMSQGNLAKESGYSRQYTNEALNNLVACGHLEIVGDKPKPGSHKTIKYILKKKLQAPTKYIFFMSATPDMNLSATPDMRKNKIVPVMSATPDTNDKNGNKIERIKKTPSPKISSKTQSGHKDSPMRPSIPGSLPTTAAQPYSTLTEATTAFHKSYPHYRLSKGQTKKLEQYTYAWTLDVLEQIFERAKEKGLTPNFVLRNEKNMSESFYGFDDNQGKKKIGFETHQEDSEPKKEEKKNPNEGNVF